MSYQLIIFDLDGTLAKSKQHLDPEMSSLLSALLKTHKVAVISGCSYKQFQNQFLSHLHCPDTNLLKNLFLFPTCGTSFYRYTNHWTKIYSKNLTILEKQKIIIAFKKTLVDTHYSHPKTYGNIIENRGTQITFSALGQNAPLSLKQSYDPDLSIRKHMKSILEHYLPEFEIRIGGTTSIDITRKGIDKSYGVKQIIKYLNINKSDILFIGDALYPDGNDYPVLQLGITCLNVSSPEETKKIISKHL